MKWLLIFAILALPLAACGNETPEQVKKFIAEKGYSVLSYEGKIDSYTLTKAKVKEKPYNLYWGLQNLDLTSYFEKTVTVEKLVVKNHPLSKNKVNVYVFVVNGEPVGGLSEVARDDNLVAAGQYSLEGKTLEEVQSKSYAEWAKEWKVKY